MLVSRETQDMLTIYNALIVKWNPKINLIAPSTLDDLDVRHINDCIQLVEYASPTCGAWVDMGSGGGLPGIVISIMTQNTDLTVTLIESDQRKAVFLRTVQRDLNLHRLEIIGQRIEDIPPLNADFISSRALAPLPKLLGYVARHLSIHGCAWLMKGRTWQAECDQASREWHFDRQHFASRTDPEAAILKISGVFHA